MRFGQVLKSQTNFKSRNKIIRVLLELWHAPVISVVWCKTLLTFKKSLWPLDYTDLTDGNGNGSFKIWTRTKRRSKVDRLLVWNKINSSCPIWAGLKSRFHIHMCTEESQPEVHLFNCESLWYLMCLWNSFSLQIALSTLKKM